MTPFEWAMVSIGVAGFVITWTTGVIGLTRAVEKIKLDTSEKVNATNEAMNARIAQLRADFQKDQKTQDHNFGEVGAAMRQYIANVEKKVYEVELWGRDNYAVKEDVKDIRDDIKAMATSIKQDFKDLTAKIDSRS